MQSVQPTNDAISLKLAVIGESSVGKTTVLHSFISQCFVPMTMSTTAAAFMKKSVQVDNHQIKFQIWDTAGQEKFRSMSALYYRSAQFILAVYDVSRKQTFDALQYWVKEVQTSGVKNAIIIVCGNKIDCPRAINRQEAEEWSQKMGASYFECSAKTSEGVQHMFEEIARMKIWQGDDDEEEEKGGQIEKQQLKQIVEEKGYQKKGCC
ncbi:Rab2a [Hexamita inflata]|uniref:Rab2a n=1 Tax=Hexamita inflata TaxID=28002 RepID=A0ABP1H4H9_9EUKA